MANLSNINNKFLVTTGGDVGIGVTGPNVKLDVNGTIKTNAIFRGDTLNNNANTHNIIYRTGTSTFIAGGDKLVVQDGGNVGIGTATPTHGKLVISSSQGNSNNYTWLLFDNQASGYGDWNIYKSGNNNLSFGYGTSNGASYSNSLTLEYGGKSTFTTDIGVLIKGASGSTGGKLSFLPASGGRQYDFKNDGSSFAIHDASAGIDRMYFNYNGNLGIGTHSPSQELEVSGNTYVTGYVQASSALIGLKDGYATLGSNSTATGIALSRDFLPSSYPDLIISSAGNVGIGTASPANKLDVKISTGNRTTLEPVMSVSANGSGPYTGFGPKISFSSNIYYGAATGNPAGIIETAYIGAVMGVTYATNSDLVFATRDGATSVTEKMRILGNGNVGIGTISPSTTEPIGGNLPTGWTRADSKALEIAAPDFASTGLFLRNSDTTATGTDITGDHYYGDTYIDNRFDNDDGSIYFRTKTAVSPQIRMAIKGSGNVGIGTGGPPSKLTVMESTLCTNSGTDGGTSYVPTKPILLVTTDGNGTPSGNYATNSVFTVGIGGGITGNVTTEHLRVNLNGNVGIGTDAPTESLEVRKDGGAIIRLHDPGNNSWKLKADTDFHIYDDSFSDYVTIKNAGQVGIGSTNAASRLEVTGVIQNQNAYLDPTFTVSATGMSLANGGTLQFTQGFVGTSSSGDTIVFRYNSISWKSWSLEFIFTSTGNGSGRHVCSGNIGGYNNNGAGYNSNFTQNFTTPITVVMTNVGQNNVITFTGDFGIHLMCTMRYSQSGGDGAPTSARASLTYNS